MANVHVKCNKLFGRVALDSTDRLVGDSNMYSKCIKQCVVEFQTIVLSDIYGRTTPLTFQ